MGAGCMDGWVQVELDGWVQVELDGWVQVVQSGGWVGAG